MISRLAVPLASLQPFPRRTKWPLVGGFVDDRDGRVAYLGAHWTCSCVTGHAVTLRLVNLLSGLRFSALNNPSGMKTGADIDQHARPYYELRDQVTEVKQAETRCGVDSQGEVACFPAHAARERSEQTLIAWPRR
jgi:hypothetical protein